jgi:hypothetical protein
MTKWYARPTLSIPEIADTNQISGCDPWREIDQGDPRIATPRHRKKLSAAANDSARHARRELAQAAP